MGQAKRWLMQQQEQGWTSVGEKYVCLKCVSDDAIKAFIEAKAVENVCSYCKREEPDAIAAHMDEVLPFVAEGINFEYEDPANSVGYCSAEGGYLLATTDSWDLMSDLDLGDSNEDFFEDLRRSFSDHDWVHKDPYGDLECDALRYNWDAFANMVKHQTRFVFFRLATTGKMAWEPEPHQILDSLRRIVTEVRLVRTVPAATNFFRAQQHAPTERLSGAKRLGTPPAEHASHSRMSPAGIPMLYAASDVATVTAEVSYPHRTRTQLTIARFQNTRPLRLLDLSTIPPVPSLFDEQRRHQRMALIFLRDFADEISKPISDGCKPYEYVPTQVMTEYFRYLFHLATEKNPDTSPPLDGLAFRSSKNPSGINYTLFIDQKGCADNDANDGAVMVLRDATTRSKRA